MKHRICVICGQPLGYRKHTCQHCKPRQKSVRQKHFNRILRNLKGAT